MINRKFMQGSGLIAGLAFGFLIAAHLLYPWAPEATQWIVIWAALEGLIAFGSLSWAFRKSDAIFYSFFLGGTVFRLFTLGLIALVLHLESIPLMVPLLSLVILYFLFSLVQIPFITYGLW
jgi:hypothetical protein